MTRVAKLHLWLWLLALVALSPVSMYRQRSCVGTNAICDYRHRCCNKNDMCMTLHFWEPTGLRSMRCITWHNSWIIYPRLSYGQTCTDSFQCEGRCCREYRAHRHDIFYECGTPYDSYGGSWHDCVTNRTTSS